MPSRRLPLIAALVVGLSFMSTTASAQDQGRGPARDAERTVTVSANGSVAAAPDVAYITTGVATEAATAREALDANNKTMAALVAGLKALSIDAKDIRTVNVGVEPRHQHFKDGRPPAIVGYRVVNQVRITSRDIGKLGETLDKSISLGANQLGGISFEVSKAETLKDEARKLAMANARRRAELYATAAGASLDKVLEISEVVSGSPQPRLYGGARMAMAEAVPVEAGQQSLEVNIHVTWSLK